ncbi:MAG: cbb3-type cytochrome c oxidase subunit I [Salinigranum sp.]
MATNTAHETDTHGPSGWSRWFVTTDHKDVGRLYLAWTILFFFLAGLLAMVFRVSLLQPGMPGWLSKGEYNAIVTMHGATMIFIVAMGALSAFGNLLLPKLVGVDEMAYPRANALSFWIFSTGTVIMWVPIFTHWILGMNQLPFAGGWTAYAPLSTSPKFLNTYGANMFFVGVGLAEIGTTIGSLNILTTFFNERSPELGLMDVPVMAWAIIVTSAAALIWLVPLIVLFAMGVLTRNYGFIFFDAAKGGWPLLYQHLFWSFGHPEVYIVLYPFLGAIAEIVPRFSHRPLYGYRAYVFSMIYIAIMASLVWAHHMFTTGIMGVRFFFMVTTLSIPVGFGIIVFCLLATIWKGRIELRTPMLFAAGSTLMLLYSGMDGVMLGSPVIDTQYQATYWVVSHFHYTLFGGVIMGFFAAVYYWFPYITGRMYNETLGKIHWGFTMAFAPLTFYGMGELGNLGMNRRYATYTAMSAQGPPSLVLVHFWHQWTTVFALLLGLGQLFLLWNVVASLRDDPVDEPWKDILDGMPSPEWDGLPYRPPTPANLRGQTDGGPARTDGSGVEVSSDD